jgi:AmmeMemoRadiSam system protein B
VDRAPAVAGRFYPGDPDALGRTVARLLGPSLSDEPAIALVAPHAGYVYSGGVAGEVFASARIPKTVIALCPNHTGLGARSAIATHGAWTIPGASIPIAESIAESLVGTGLFHGDERAHEREHALEVMLPFLRARNADVEIVPICLGRLDTSACRELGAALAAVVESSAEELLLLASTDMSHYVPAELAKERDMLALERIAALDPAGLHEVVEREDISMCGYVPTTVTLFAAKALGAKSATLLRYTNSGEASGDFASVVGYAGLVVR